MTVTELPLREAGAPPHSRRCACADPACSERFIELGQRRRPDPDIRRRLIEQHIDFAKAVARRLGSAELALQDLVQIAMLAMIEAVDRFDPARGVPFSAFAGPTISGVLKRHFRDYRTVRPPRRANELCERLRMVSDTLTQSLGRYPTDDELAEQVGADAAVVREALQADEACRPLSMDAPMAQGHTAGDRRVADLADLVGHDDEALEMTEYIQSLRLLLQGLPDRQRRAVELRFFADMTQSEIGTELDCSQMHVSRLLRAALHQLRLGLDLPTDAVTRSPKPHCAYRLLAS